MKPLLTTGVFPHRNVEKMMKFSNFHEILIKNSLISKFMFEELPMKEIFRIDYKWGDLLY